METVISGSMITAITIRGVLPTHLLNDRHNERIAAFHYAEPEEPAAGKPAVSLASPPCLASHPTGPGRRSCVLRGPVAVFGGG